MRDDRITDCLCRLASDPRRMFQCRHGLTAPPRTGASATTLGSPESSGNAVTKQSRFFASRFKFLATYTIDPRLLRKWGGIPALVLLTTVHNPSASATDWVNLFDGKTLDGWVQKNGTATYRVEEGAIVGRTSEGSPNSFLAPSKITVTSNSSSRSRCTKN